MSFGNEMLPQINHIKRIVAQENNGSAVVQSTNKRVISRCTDRVDAKALAFLLNSDGWACEVRRGRKSAFYYVQAFLNRPYY